MTHREAPHDLATGNVEDVLIVEQVNLLAALLDTRIVLEHSNELRKKKKSTNSEIEMNDEGKRRDLNLLVIKAALLELIDQLLNIRVRRILIAKRIQHDQSISQ